MTSPKPPLCIYCVHILPPHDHLMSCSVFKTIPGAIAWNQLDHRQPIPGDGGIQFEQDPKEPPIPTETYDRIFTAETADDE